MATKPGGRYAGRYGNSAGYLVARIARDHPEILERMKAGEFPSVRQGAIEAGIPHVVRDSPKNPDRDAERIARAWVNADFDAKRTFCIVFGVELERVMSLVWQNRPDEEQERLTEQVKAELLPPRRGPRPWGPSAAEPIPVIEAAIRAGLSTSEIARRLGVTYATVKRWRHGETRPSAEMLAKIKATLSGDNFPQSLY